MGITTLWMACVLLPLCLEAQESGTERHSLYYVYTALSSAISAPGVFEFTAMGLLDDRKIDYYNSKDQVKIPQQGWMKDNLDADYWTKGTQSRKSKEQWFKVNVNILMERMRHNASDLHVLMWRHGCEVDVMPDGKSMFVRGVDEYSYDGVDFLSFDDASMNWVAPVVQAEPTKNKWDRVPILNQYTKGYLEKECVDWLDKFRNYAEKDLKQLINTIPPEVRLFAKQSKTSGAVMLTCMATGFYPKDIEIAILKNKLVMKKGDVRDVLPNGDGTHQIRLSVEAGSSELGAYSCEVNHRGLQKKVERTWAKDGEMCLGESSAFLVGIVVGALCGVVVLGVLAFIAFKKGYFQFVDGRFNFNGFSRTNAKGNTLNGSAVQNGIHPVVSVVSQPLLNGAANANGNNSHGSSGGSDQNGSDLNEVQVDPSSLLTGQPAQEADADSGQGSQRGSDDQVNAVGQG